MNRKLPVFMVPACFIKFYRKYRDKQFTMLDVGCGNHAVRKAKWWFDQCVYTGLDRTDPTYDELDRRLTDAYFKVDLDHICELVRIPDNAYDVVLLVHVIEHLQNGLEALNNLSHKVKLGGCFYVEFPSVNSLSLPHMKGTLNFCDDPTHVHVYDVKEIANVLLRNGFRVVSAGRRRHPLLFALAPILIIYGAVKNRRLTAFGFWDLLHFADYVFAVKITENNCHPLERPN